MLYMFHAVPPPIIRSSKTVCTESVTLSKIFCYLRRSWKRWNSRQWQVAKGFDKVTDAVYTVFELLMMGGGTA